MDTRSKKNLIKPGLLLSLFIFAGYLLYILLTPTNVTTINLHFLDVGQGDSLYLELPQGQNILIDGGPDGSAARSLDRLVPFYNKEIDHVIMTHPHADHLAGLEKVLKEYKVGTFYLTEETNNTPEYISLLETLKKKNVTVKKVKAGDKILFPEGIVLDFLYPSTLSSDNINNSSIVTELSWGEKKAIFMGDLEAEAQQNMIGTVSEVDLLKVAHHCSSDAINKNVYQKLSPNYTVISVGKDNKFGHPSQSCLQAISSSKVYRTDQDGQVDFTMSRTAITELP